MTPNITFLRYFSFVLILSLFPVFVTFKDLKIYLLIING